MIRGIDVSSYQPDLVWDVIREAGGEFAIVKTSEGNNFLNPIADRQVDGAIGAGILTMLYHFARPSGTDWLLDAKAEAGRIIERAERYAQKYGRTFFSFLDVERNDALSLSERPLWKMWCNTVRAECRDKKHPIGFYSYGPFTENLSLEDDWSNTLLWLAKYPSQFQRDPTKYPTWPACWPSVRPWPRADIWQDGGDANQATWPGVLCVFCKGEGCPIGTAHAAGCTAGLAHTDVDVFAGSRAELEDLIDSAA